MCLPKIVHAACCSTLDIYICLDFLYIYLFIYQTDPDTSGVMKRPIGPQNPELFWGGKRGDRTVPKQERAIQGKTSEQKVLVLTIR